MNVTRIWIEVLAGAVVLGLGLAGCDDDSGGGPSDAGDGGADTGSDTEWHTPIDGSVWGEDAGEEEEVEPDCECSDPTCGIEYTCEPGVKECLCDTVCDSGAYSAMGWGGYFQSYRCYEPCDGGGPCSREGDVCTQLPGFGAPELCLPRISAESGEFDIKVLPEGSEFSAVDMAQVDVQLLVGGEERHLVNGFATAYDWDSPSGIIDLVFMEPGVGDEFYYLDMYVFEDFWAPGTVELTTDGTHELDARLYRMSDDMWMAGLALTGTIELVETMEPDVCDGPGCPKSIVGSMSLELYGLEAEIPED